MFMHKDCSSAEASVEKEKPNDLRRRGVFAAAWAAMFAFVLRRSSQPVHAAAAMQFQNAVASEPLPNIALGPTAIYSDAGYPSAYGVLNGLAFGGQALSGLTGGAGSSYSAPPFLCGVYGYQTRATTPSAGVLGEDRTLAQVGIGVLGRSGATGLGSSVGVQGEAGSGIGVRGLIPQTSNASAIAVYGLNYSTYTGPGPGAGGFAVYGLSAKGHGLVGATATAGGAAVVGATNGVAGAYAAAFYGPTAIGGDLIVYGSKSAAVPHPDGTHRLLYCVESPECWFEDFGKGTLSCGRGAVAIDPDFAAIADLTDYHVFVTPCDVSHDLCVAEQTAKGFTIVAHDPTASTRFAWRVVAKRKDIEAKRLAEVTMPPAPVLPDFPKTKIEQTDEPLPLEAR
jgi:hypothetical protein